MEFMWRIFIFSSAVVVVELIIFGILEYVIQRKK